jgi:predicted transcriptional regulator
MDRQREDGFIDTTALRTKYITLKEQYRSSTENNDRVMSELLPKINKCERENSDILDRLADSGVNVRSLLKFDTKLIREDQEYQKKVLAEANKCKSQLFKMALDELK